MKVNPFDLIKQELGYLNSRIEFLKKELSDNYNSESSKYELQKDLNSEISKLGDLHEEIRMLAEELKA